MRMLPLGAAALLALSALLLLLLACLPPPPPTPRASHPPSLNITQTLVAATTPQDVSTAPVASNVTEDGPQKVRDLYESGHSTPHPETCPALGAAVQVLVLVTSAPEHKEAREAVRLTWGHYRSRADVALAFVLGAPPAALAHALQAEDALYGDLIVGRSLDSYSNLTLKTLSMLEWADTYCPRAPFLLKTDDDMFINVPRLLKFVDAHKTAKRTIWGHIFRKVPPVRKPKSKYFVPESEFSGRVFPDFTSGPAYLMTRDCVRPLLQAALSERYLRLEDVLVTGVVASRLRIHRVDANEFYNRRISGRPCDVQKYISVHMVRYHEQFDYWRKLLDGRSKCPK